MGKRRWKASGRVLKGLAYPILLTLPAPADAQFGGAGAFQRVDRWSAPIREASARFGIPEAWIKRVMRAESGGQTTLDGRPITSTAGAMGLMQVMPKTWAEMRRTYKLGPDPHDPRDNVLAGAAYLRAMYDRFGYPGLFAAYNAGPARYAEYLTTGRSLPAETAAYVAVVGRTSLRPSAPWEESASSMFIVLSGSRPPGIETASQSVASSALFARLSTVSAQSH